MTKYTKQNTCLGLVCAVSVMWLFSSCKKKDDHPVVPVIAFVSVSETSVEQFNNNLEITFTYEDYQGDLGRQDPDDYSLRVRDARLSDYDWYHIPPMTPEMQELHIKGTYVLQLDPLFLMGTGDQEATSFTLQVQDRAGNWSNIIETPVITVLDSL